MINVPFKRVLTPPKLASGKIQTGADVLALKRVVSRAGCWPWQEFNQQYTNDFSLGIYNKLGVKKPGCGGLKQLQKNLGLKHADGVWNAETHLLTLDYKVPHGIPHAGEWIWDQFSINQYLGYEDLTAAEQIVNEIWKWWDFLVTHEPYWHYLQQRPVKELVDRLRPPYLPGYSDCSGTAIYCAWLGGAKSPDVHFGYSGYGNTDSLVTGGFQISEADIAKYAPNHYLLAFYGPSSWNTEHVTAVRSASQNYSHGRESDPRVYDTIHYRSDFLQVRAYTVI